ncbi:hypothetical protein GE061_016155 [Apolygus lucorum]|uniref:Uncharacterized protein n=1 Tax=Apolygus lucorum TaxID=248454 RepID=A0A8S9XFE6_APOLU|nr:hypothetical protein GE061_016155 [Apolygus lucorum]
MDARSLKRMNARSIRDTETSFCLVSSTHRFNSRNQNRILTRVFQASDKLVDELDKMEKYRSHQLPSRNLIPPRKPVVCYSAQCKNINHIRPSSAVLKHKMTPEAVRSEPQRKSPCPPRGWENSRNQTLENRANCAQNIGDDDSITYDKFVGKFLGTPDINEASSVIVEDERTYQPRNPRENDRTFGGVQPSSTSWRPSREEMFLHQSRPLNDSTNRHLCGSSANKQKCPKSEHPGYYLMDENERRYRAMNPIVNDTPFEEEGPSNISWRLSPEEISLYESHALNDSTCRHFHASCGNKQKSTKSHDSQYSPNMSGIDKADMHLPPPGASGRQPDRDEESAMKRNQFGNDISIQGIETSNISWQMNSSDISLYREHVNIKSWRSERFLQTEHRMSRIPEHNNYY